MTSQERHPRKVDQLMELRLMTKTLKAFRPAAEGRSDSGAPWVRSGRSKHDPEGVEQARGSVGTRCTTLSGSRLSIEFMTQGAPLRGDTGLRCSTPSALGKT